MSSTKYNPEVMDLELRVFHLEEALEYKTPDNLSIMMSKIKLLQEAWKIFDKRILYGHCIISHTEYRTIQRIVEKTIQIGEERINTWNLLLSLESVKDVISYESSSQTPSETDEIYLAPPNKGVEEFEVYGSKPETSDNDNNDAEAPELRTSQTTCKPREFSLDTHKNNDRESSIEVIGLDSSDTNSDALAPTPGKSREYEGERDHGEGYHTNQILDVITGNNALEERETEKEIFHLFSPNNKLEENININRAKVTVPVENMNEKYFQQATPQEKNIEARHKENSPEQEVFLSLVPKDRPIKYLTSKENVVNVEDVKADSFQQLSIHKDEVAIKVTTEKESKDGVNEANVEHVKNASERVSKEEADAQSYKESKMNTREDNTFHRDVDIKMETAVVDEKSSDQDKIKAESSISKEKVEINERYTRPSQKNKGNEDANSHNTESRRESTTSSPVIIFRKNVAPKIKEQNETVSYFESETPSTKLKIVCLLLLLLSLMKRNEKEIRPHREKEVQRIKKPPMGACGSSLNFNRSELGLVVLTVVFIVDNVIIERQNKVMDKDIPVQYVHLLLCLSLKLLGC